MFGTKLIAFILTIIAAFIIITKGSGIWSGLIWNLVAVFLWLHICIKEYQK